MNLKWFGPLVEKLQKQHEQNMVRVAAKAAKEGVTSEVLIERAQKLIHKGLEPKVRIKLNDELQRVLDLPDVDAVNAPDYTDKLLIDPKKRFWKDGREARLRPVQNQMLHAMAQAGGGFFLVSVGGGKCVREHCRVYDARRSLWREAGTLVGRSLTTVSVDENTRTLRRNNARGFSSGCKPCVDVHLSSGAVLPVSTDHLVLTADRGWLAAGDLGVGQPLVASRQYGLPGVFPPGLAGGICTEQVTSVVHTGVHPVVDLSVDRDHNFLAEGVCIHNSFAALLAGSVIPGIERVLVFTPSSTVNNLNAEMYRLRNLFKLCPVMDIRSTDELSRPRTEADGDLLEELVFAKKGDPSKTLIVVDEAHRLKNVSSARGGRVLRFVLAHPEVRLVVMSGTMTSTSVKDCAHLSWYALRDGSPFPARWGRDSDEKHNTMLEALAQCIDQKGKPEAGHWTPMFRLWNKYHPYIDMWQVSGPERVSMLRRAFQARMRTAAGVVFTTGSSVPGLPLTLKGMKCEVPPEVTKSIQDLLNGLDPNGMPIPDDLSMQRIESQLGQGFYYVWDWPKDPGTGKPRVDLDWKGAKSRWGKLVREEIKECARTGYDSDMLVYNTCKNLILHKCNNDKEKSWVHWVSRTDKDMKIENLEIGDRDTFDHIWTTLQQRIGSDDLLQSWLSWSAIQKHKKEPPTKPVWISTFLMDHVVAWARAQEVPPIIWFEHRAVGERLAAMGVPTYGAGTDPPGKETLCALSRRAHGEGKNLQAWSNQVFLSPVPGAVAWEQTLGRTHRPDPSRDVKDRPPITAYIYQHADVYVEALNKARQGATYIQDTTDNEQKLLYCAYEGIKLRKVTFATEEMLDEEDDEE